MFSPDGRNFQVEYAGKAVENGGTSIGIKCKDGVVLAVQKIVGSKLLVPGANKRIQTVDKNVGIAYSGLVPDGRSLVDLARDDAAKWRQNYGDAIPVKSLAERMGLYVQAYTSYSSVRPFGVTAIIGGLDPQDGPVLYMIEPSGSCFGYMGAATGKGRQVAKSELEKLPLGDITALQAIKEAAKIIYLAHEESKDSEFELEITWVCSETKGRHEPVPASLLKEATQYAMTQLSGEGEEMEED